MSGGQELQVVTFGLGAETFAVPVTLVREILDYRETFRIPNGPDYLLGLTELRGEGVTTVDFRLRVGLPHVEPTPSTRILVVDVPFEQRVLVLGLVVDRVLDVSTFDLAEIAAAPDLGVRWPSRYITGVAKRPEGFVVLVDVIEIFSAEETRSLQPSGIAA
ncbi:CheW protein [Novosphingobium sp. Rr 2-17]|uniref:chemotaxis protein CheW n=1 Tax=Novosphingobium sp. Rr 2-17 TaxID=555793 RepID=UPI0002699194|nr:chemotaxis protein CheW [Novosphingobium sp. Rr 2-17]EIZ80631.1 CheW protein [Novosphingobium sp. Rr 2-17]